MSEKPRAPIRTELLETGLFLGMGFTLGGLFTLTVVGGISLAILQVINYFLFNGNLAIQLLQRTFS